MCFGCLKEPSHQDGSFEYPQHMFWLRNALLSGGLWVLVQFVIQLLVFFTQTSWQNVQIGVCAQCMLNSAWPSWLHLCEFTGQRNIHADSEESDQSGWKCPLVGFVVRRLGIWLYRFLIFAPLLTFIMWRILYLLSLICELKKTSPYTPFTCVPQIDYAKVQSKCGEFVAVAYYENEPMQDKTYKMASQVLRCPNEETVSAY